MQIFASHIHMEMQQRGSEYSQLFLKYDNLRPALLERMPPLEVSHHSSHISEITNGEQTPSPMSGDELAIAESEPVQDPVSAYISIIKGFNHWRLFFVRMVHYFFFVCV